MDIELYALDLNEPRASTGLEVRPRRHFVLWELRRHVQVLGRVQHDSLADILQRFGRGRHEICHRTTSPGQVESGLGSMSQYI